MAGDVSGNIPQLILLRTFGYSRSVPVVLAQWQHLMMSFIHCVAWKSKICHRIDPNPTGKLTIKKNFKFSPQNSLKCFHFEITKQKICHSEAPSPVRSVTTPPHTHPFRLFVPQLWTRVDAADYYCYYYWFIADLTSERMTNIGQHLLRLLVYEIWRCIFWHTLYIHNCRCVEVTWWYRRSPRSSTRVHPVFWHVPSHLVDLRMSTYLTFHALSWGLVVQWLTRRGHQLITLIKHQCITWFGYVQLVLLLEIFYYRHAQNAARGGPVWPAEDWRKLPLFVAHNERLTIVQTQKPCICDLFPDLLAGWKVQAEFVAIRLGLRTVTLCQYVRTYT